MENTSILIWNVRGLNDRGRRDNLRKVVDDFRPSVVCLQETKLNHISERDVISFLGRDFSEFVFLPAQHTRGGILIAWRDQSFSVEHHFVHRFSVSVLLNSSTGSPWWLTGVYGPKRDEDKLSFLAELREVRSSCPGPWMIAGDFNMIYSSEDKNNDNVNRVMMGRFRRFVNDLELKEIPLLGRRYTWSNERASPTLVKLDRVLCTNDWEDLYPESLLQSAATEMSDHCPLVLGLCERIAGKRRFHFESFWPRLPGFYETVQQSWDAPVSTHYPLQCISIKLKRLARALQSWSQKQTGNIKKQLALARHILHHLEMAQDIRDLSVEENWFRCKLKRHCLVLSSLERTIARLRSRVRYLKDGDANTSFFHKQASCRRRKNFIYRLKDGNQVVTSQQEKHQILFDYFDSVLGTAAQRPCTLELPAFHRAGTDLSALDVPFTEEEVWATIRSLPADRAPGPDGYTGKFYKTC